MKLIGFFAVSVLSSVCARADVLAEFTIDYPGGNTSNSGGLALDFSKFDAGFWIYEPAIPVINSIKKGEVFTLRPFPASSIGSAEDTVTPSTDPGFAAVARELTDGTPDGVGAFSTVYRVGGGPALQNGIASFTNNDFALAGSQTTDFFGYEITSITRRVEILNITPTPTGAQFGRHRSYFRIEGRVPEPSCAVALAVSSLLLTRRRT